MTNRVMHFELPASDLAKAQSFYGTVFGWKFRPWDENYVSVIAAESDAEHRSTEVGAINGGLQKKGPRAQTPTIVVDVDDIDVTIVEVQAHGGTVAIPKEAMSGMGYYAQIEDPDGNRVGLFQSMKI